MIYLRQVIIDAHLADAATQRKLEELVDKYGILGSPFPDLAHIELYPEEDELQTVLSVVTPQCHVTVTPRLE